MKKQLVSDHVASILETKFNEMCDKDQKDDIKRCYMVLSWANEHMSVDSESVQELMKARLIEYVRVFGRKIVSNNTDSLDKGK